jgi:hypothetical protein
VAVWRFNEEGKIVETLGHESPQDVEAEVRNQADVTGYAAFWLLRPQSFTPG